MHLAASLPPMMGYAIAVQRADFRFLLDRPMRTKVQQDLKEAFGGKFGSSRFRRVTRDFFRFQSCKTLDTVRIYKDPRSYLRLVEVVGMENINAALDQGRGVILCSAHFNASNLLAVLSVLGLPVRAVARWSFGVRRSRRRRFIPLQIKKNIDFAHLVRPTIMTSPEKKNRPISAAVEAAQVLRRNEAIYMPIDVGVRDPEGTERVGFLNGQATLQPGIVLIAKLTQAPMLMTTMHRSADWRRQRVEITGPIPAEGEVNMVLQRCLAFVEAYIRREPAQWDLWGRRSELGLLAVDSEQEREDHQSAFNEDEE